MKRFPLARKLLFRLRPRGAAPSSGVPAGRFPQETLDELVAAAEACDLERLARLRARLHGSAGSSA